MRARMLTAALAVFLLLTGCAERDRGERGPVPLGTHYVDEAIGFLTVEVSSCNGEAELGSLEETETEVRIEAIATTYEEREDCLDGLTLELDDPLGDRKVVDAVTGRELRPDESMLEPQS